MPAAEAVPAAAPLLEAQGALSVAPAGPWRLGHLALRPGQLTFGPRGRPPLASLALDASTTVEVVTRRFVGFHKRTLLLGHPGAGRSCRWWVLTAAVVEWEDALRRRLPTGTARPPLRRPDLAPPGPAPEPVLASEAGPAALEQVTPAAARLLDRLAPAGFATTAELAGVLGGDQAGDLLPVLEAHLSGLAGPGGRPAVRYEAARWDPAERRLVRHCWWLDASLAAAWLAQRDPADVLDEGDAFLAVIPFPTDARAGDLVVSLGPGGASLEVDASRYRRSVPLPGPATGPLSWWMGPAGTLAVRAVRAVRAGRDAARERGPQAGGRP